MGSVVSNRLRNELQKFSGMPAVMLTGRATTALYLLLRQCLPVGSGVVVPATVCPHVPAAVLLAGMRPVFCDVSNECYTLDGAALSKLLDGSEVISAVVAVETFGHPVDPTIYCQAQRKGLPVFLDRAQSLVNHAHDSEAIEGSFFSFGYSKLPDVGWGGGLATKNKAVLSAIADEEKKLSLMQAGRLAELEHNYRQMYYAWANKSDTAKSASFLKTLVEPFREMYVFRGGPDEAKIKEQVALLENEIEHRRFLTSFLVQHLQAPGITHPLVDVSRVRWRYTFEVEASLRSGVVTALRDAGLHVSTWYPACHKWFGSAAACKVAERLSQTLVNLWIDGSVDQRYCMDAVCVIHRFLKTRL